MGKLKKTFKIGEDVMWKFSDFDSQGEQNVKCKIMEVHEDYCVAQTKDNHNNYDAVQLYIDEFNEDEFQHI